ncbi:DUF3592 domain-containing protein [Breznakiellaceae bacterium SP9]
MNWGLFLTGFLFFAIMVSTGTVWAYHIRQNAKMKRCITVEGTLLSATMTSYEKRKSHTRYGVDTYYEPVMEYTYTVGGQKYTSASVVFGGKGYSSVIRGAIEKMIDHPVGGPITVFYNPDKPDESFLDKEASSNLFEIVVWGICTAFTALFGAVGIWAMVTGILGKPS